MKGPMDLFFKMGEKATKGDPDKQADFIYYMVWILFTAFLWLFLHNAYQLIWNKDLNAATWTLVGFAICGIQYFSLKGMYDMKQMKKTQVVKASEEEEKVDSVADMLETFNESVKKEVKKKDVRKKSNK